MQPRHRTRFDTAAQARAHHEVIAITQAFDERLQVAEVVGAVGIRHDDEVSARRIDAAPDRIAVAANFFPDDPSACAAGGLGGAVGGIVVDD